MVLLLISRIPPFAVEWEIVEKILEIVEKILEITEKITEKIPTAGPGGGWKGAKYLIFIRTGTK